MRKTPTESARYEIWRTSIVREGVCSVIRNVTNWSIFFWRFFGSFEISTTPMTRSIHTPPLREWQGVAEALRVVCSVLRNVTHWIMSKFEDTRTSCVSQLRFSMAFYCTGTVQWRLTVGTHRSVSCVFNTDTDQHSWAVYRYVKSFVALNRKSKMMIAFYGHEYSKVGLETMFV